MSTNPTDPTDGANGGSDANGGEAAGCIEDNSAMTRARRARELDNVWRKYPEAKCSEAQFGPLVKTFYKSYQSYPVDFKNCDKRNKAFVVSDDCKNFKFAIKGTIPDVDDYLNRYKSCVLNGESGCNKIMDDLENARLDHAMKSAYDKCTKHYGACGIYDVNGMQYKYSATPPDGYSSLLPFDLSLLGLPVEYSVAIIGASIFCCCIIVIIIIAMFVI